MDEQSTFGGSDKSRGKSFFDLKGEIVRRYVWVSDLVRGLRVIDVGCGDGYGSHYLAENAAEFVIGVDSDPIAIAYALHNYVRRNLQFRLIDVYTLETLSDLFDAAVSFEVIEHLKNPRAYLGSISRSLKNNGRLYLSTPNRRYTERFYVDGKSPNPFHIREYYPDEIKRLLEEFFSIEGVFWEVSTTGLETIIEANAEHMSNYKKSFLIPASVRNLVPSAVKDAWLNFRGFGKEPSIGKWKEYRIEETTVGELDAKFPVQLYCCKKA